MRESSARASAGLAGGALVRRGAGAEPPVAVPGEGAPGVPAWATDIGRSIVSRTASIGSAVLVMPPTALPAVSMPVRAAAPAVAMSSAAPMTTPTAQTRPPCSPSLNSASSWEASAQRVRRRPAI